jgi:regulator of cell morphogenesis and NO signaling
MAMEQNQTVREIVISNPGAARTLEKFGIDYCCGGGKSLAEACSFAKVDMGQVVTELDRPQTKVEEHDWQKAPLAELAGFIVSKHHAFTREEIARLLPLIAKVVGVHAQNHPELRQIQGLFHDLAEELTMHMMKEERMLFLYIALLEEALSKGRRPAPPMFGTVQNPVRMMMLEHDSAGDALHKIREITGGYAVPEDACVSYRTLYTALLEFEADLHQHIHLENNILFPRAVELESQAF